MTVISLLLMVAGRRKSTGGGGAVVVVPFEPGEKSGGARAIKDFLDLLNKRVVPEVVCVDQRIPSQSVRARVARVLVWPLPLPHQCRHLLLGDPDMQSKLDRADVVIFEFISTALVLYGWRRPAAFVVIRDHEVLTRRIAMDLRAASGIRALVDLLRLIVCYLVSVAVYLRADRIIALTEQDRDWIVKHFPWVARRTVYIPVPFRHEAREPPEGLPKVPTRELLMVANFFHSPNVDAVRWFVRECAPHLESGFRLHLCGLDRPLDALNLSGSPIEVVRHGFIDDLQTVVPGAAIAVAPVVSGGGVRVKNLMLASQGKVVVTTPLGNEGIGFVDGRDAIISATGAEMARRINEVSSSAVEIVRFGRAARAFVELRFSPEAVLVELERHVPLAQKGCVWGE